MAINDVLKALNHDLRRDMIQYLQEVSTLRSVTFTDLLESMKYETKNSGSFSYHLKLLLDAGLVSKTEDNTYSITSLGEKANAMVSLVNDDKESSGQQLYNTFKHLTTFSQLLVAWFPFSLFLFVFTVDNIINNGLMLTVVDILLFIGTLSLFLVMTIIVYSRLQSFLGLLIIGNLVWLAFLPSHQIRLGTISALTSLGAVAILQLIFPDFLLNVIFFIVLMTFAGILSLYHLWEGYRINWIEGNQLTILPSSLSK